MKQRLLKIATRFDMFDDKPLNAEFSIEDYYDEYFVLHEIGHGRNIREIHVHEVTTISHLIERLAPQDACFMGTILGELYAALSRQGAAIALPNNRLSSLGAQLAFFAYDTDTAMINYLNKREHSHHHMYLLELTGT